MFLAEDLLLGGRHVALKHLAEVDELSRAALEREFSTLASLSLPGVARVFDFGLVEDAMPDSGTVGAFFTRAFVDGQPLDVAIANLTPIERVRLFGRVASRVRALHAAGFVHGDIKPANVIIDASGDAHLIDFGLARAASAQRSRDAAGGTPAFMAPELFDGESASASTDIYALGCTLWLLIAGSAPFGNQGQRVRAGKHARPPVPPTPDNINASMREVLAVARRAFDANAADRFPTVGELIAALERAVPLELNVTHEWIAPRSRGHQAFVDSLHGHVLELARSGGSLLLSGACGSGRTTLLRAIKWFCQLRGWPVIELAVRSGEGATTAVSLMEQARLLAGEDDVARSSPVAARDPVSIAVACATEVLKLAARHPVLILIDDLDHAERVIGELLRSLVHNERGLPVVVVASVQSTQADAAVELFASKHVEVPALPEAAVRALAIDALGALDESVLHALVAQCAGLPGPLLAALRSLSPLIAPTAADVNELDVHGFFAARAQHDAAALSVDECELLALISVLDNEAPLPLLGDMIARSQQVLEGLVLRLVERGALRRNRSSVSCADARLTAAVRARLGDDRRAELALSCLRSAAVGRLSVLAHARLAIEARASDVAATWVPRAVAELRVVRAHRAAADLVAGWTAFAEGQASVDAQSMLAELQHDAGAFDDAAQTAQVVLAAKGANDQQRAQAAVLWARVLTARGEFERALDALGQVPSSALPTSKARVCRERAKIHLRQGRYDEVIDDAQRGLEIADANDVVRVELLTSFGMAESYRGNQSAARQRYEQALSLARQAGSQRDVANSLAYLAIASLRGGDVQRARDLFAESLVIARDTGDVGGMANFSLNVGAMDFYLGAVGSAAEHYASSIKLAQRAGRASTALQARNNLAHVHIYFGLFEQARAEAESVVVEAARSGLRMIAAQATVLLGDLCARDGDVDGALVRYDEASRIYQELGQQREVADVHLDAAEAILDRGGPADTSAAAARLATARTLIQTHDLADYRMRLSWLLCRAQIGSGEVERALSELSSIVEQAKQQGARDVLWNALATMARAHELLGASFRARRCDEQAVEVLEEIALQVPAQHREAFWKEPRRREARRRAESAAVDSAGVSQVGDLRRDRLLEIIKRLASEHDLDRLLERITESAVELSGAERGFVLLVDAAGKLEKRTERSADQINADPHAAFSRSIAEAVLIDGEPIVTVDASSDQRVNEYLSVHRLMLRSLACLPIRGRRGVVGVLYLEHRRHRGRFSDADIDVLYALADQAAIALDNARLIAADAAARRELEDSNRALEQAKREMEALLIARTEELEQARLALEDARVSPPLEANRHGMIGRSSAMRRVFETIDRLGNNDVPVAILGESGTGKELVARAIHRSGTRAAGPFVVVNCGAIPENLIESELFGHVRGAFTGADRDKQGLVTRASGGTLFLDEVSEMSPKMQIDLLRVVQERTIRPVGGDHDVPVDVRFVTASNRPLDDMIAAKTFREDLYYRLNVVQLKVPPLRERREDIPLLCEHFLRSFAKRDGKPAKRLSTEAIERLCAHPLPGNVRQLEHLLLNAWVLVDGTIIRGDHLALDRGNQPEPIVEVPFVVDVPLPPANVEEHREHERRKILESLERHAWNRVQAAAALGMPRRTFYRRLRDYSII